jgi:hypothetical protein
MRRPWWVVVLCGLVGCYGDNDPPDFCIYEAKTYWIGQTFPAGDGCNTCLCNGFGVECTADACPDGATSCAPSEGCEEGPACAGACCGAGEVCIAGECRCGDRPACPPGDSCGGGADCGVICCGVSSPCPQ